MNHKKIAELANVSASTVSKALAGSSEVSKKTAERIRKIAIESGYFKEKGKRKREYTNAIMIAVLVPEIAGGHYSSLVTCIKDEVEARGGNVAVYIYNFNKDKKNEILNSIILRGGVDGIIMFSSPDFSIKPNIPIVCFGEKNMRNFDSISTNTQSVLDDSVEYLKNLGHRKIGFVGEFHTISKSDAFVRAMEKHELDCREDFIHIINDRFEAIGTKAAEKIISENDRPTALIAAYDEIALALIHEFSKNGINVPDDISVMGINNIASAAYANVPLTTVDLFSKEKYKTAVEILFDKIINETAYVKHITVQHKIIERETTKKIGR